MKKLLLAIAFAMTSMLLPLAAQTYYTPSSDVEVVYTSVANLEAAVWAVDKNGEKNYVARSKKATINPETDEAYESATTMDGIYLKEINSNAGRSIVFYITGITEFKAYACDDKATTDPRYVEVTYNAVGEDSVVLENGANTVQNDKSSIITISQLDASKKYRFHVNANNKDMCLYAIKLTKGGDVVVVPELVSVLPQAGATEVEIEQTISFTYSTEVNLPPQVTVNEVAVAPTTENNKTFTIPYTLEYATTYTVVVGETTAIEGETVVTGKTWSFTTEDVAVCPVELITEAKTWDVSSAEGETVVDNTLYFSNATKRSDGVRMNRASGGVYMMFALPADVEGTFSFRAKSSGSGTRTIKYLLSNTFDYVPTESEGTEIAGVVDTTECSVDIVTTEITYVFIYNNSGNTDYYDLAWTPAGVEIDALIESEKIYYLQIDETWATAEGDYVAKFTNQNNGSWADVVGEVSQQDANIIMFYLSSYNTNVVTRAAVEPLYTHVEFTKGNMTTGELYYADNTYRTYNVATDSWIVLDTSVEIVEAAGGIVYANGVITTDGAIEVYDMSGVVVARGNDCVDIRALNGGIYVVCCGDNVRKVVR